MACMAAAIHTAIFPSLDINNVVNEPHWDLPPLIDWQVAKGCSHLMKGDKTPSNRGWVRRERFDRSDCSCDSKHIPFACSTESLAFQWLCHCREQTISCNDTTNKRQ